MMIILIHTESSYYLWVSWVHRHTRARTHARTHGRTHARKKKSTHASTHASTLLYHSSSWPVAHESKPSHSSWPAVQTLSSSTTRKVARPCVGPVVQTIHGPWRPGPAARPPCSARPRSAWGAPPCSRPTSTSARFAHGDGPAVGSQIDGGRAATALAECEKLAKVLLRVSAASVAKHVTHSCTLGARTYLRVQAWRKAQFESRGSDPYPWICLCRAVGRL